MSQLRKRGQRSESIPWATLQDGNLSYTARGILGYVLSMPPGWQFSADRIAKECDNQGRDAVLKALRELETAGYRIVTTERDERGRIRSYADFAYVPQPEWIEAARRRAAKKSTSRKPGPKRMGSAAKQAALESLNGDKAHETTFPQVAPEAGIPESGEPDSGQPAQTDVSAGRTGSGDTGIRSPGLLRGSDPENNYNREARTGDPDAGGGGGGGGVPQADLDALRAVLRPEVYDMLTLDERGDLAATIRCLLDAGWTTDAIRARKVDRRVNTTTTHPATHIRRAIDTLASESAPTQVEDRQTGGEVAAIDADRAERRAARHSPVRDEAARLAVDQGADPAAAAEWAQSSPLPTIERWVKNSMSVPAHLLSNQGSGGNMGALSDLAESLGNVA